VERTSLHKVAHLRSIVKYNVCDGSKAPSALHNFCGTTPGHQPTWFTCVHSVLFHIATSHAQHGGECSLTQGPTLCRREKIHPA
jgi:hypothetical protein